MTRPVRRQAPRDVDYYGRPHHVYRAFDSYGLLLYVGCSLSVHKRLATHRSGPSPWFRFAESIGIFGPWDRTEALARERHAIDNEGPYFNSSHADMVRTRANQLAARRRMAERGDVQPDFDLERYEREGDEYGDAKAREHSAWCDRMAREERRLKESGLHPCLTDADRMARYLAARQDSETARLEAMGLAS